MNALVLLAFLLAQQEKPVDLCTMSGTAVNAATGEPLNKVKILAEGTTGESGETPATVSDANGHFTLVRLRPGQLRLKAERNGFLDGAYGARRAEGNGTPLALTAGEEMKNLTIRLTPFGVIAGTVRDSDGEPLARIPVTVHRLRYEEGHRNLSKTGGAYTDDLGQYRIPDLPPGKYYVYADAHKAGQFGSMWQDERVTEDHSPKDAPRAQVAMPTVYPAVQDLAAGGLVTGVDITLTRSTTVPVKGRVVAPPGLQVEGVELGGETTEFRWCRTRH